MAVLGVWRATGTIWGKAFTLGGLQTDSAHVALLRGGKSRVAVSRIGCREAVLTCRGAYCYPNSSRGEGKERREAHALPWDSKDRNSLLPHVMASVALFMGYYLFLTPF